MVYIQELLIYICIRVSRDTYNRRGMSNMQLNDGRPGRMARGREVVVPPLPSASVFSSPAFNYYAQCARRGGGRRPGNEATFFHEIA